jgi:hypothetical protein
MDNEHGTDNRKQKAENREQRTKIEISNFVILGSEATPESDSGQARMTVSMTITLYEFTDL